MVAFVSTAHLTGRFADLGIHQILQLAPTHIIEHLVTPTKTFTQKEEKITNNDDNDYDNTRMITILINNILTLLKLRRALTQNRILAHQEQMLFGLKRPMQPY
jgi:hypothetical protein